jgi:hypothetical protein
VTALGDRCKRLPAPSSIFSTRQARSFLVEAGAVAAEGAGAVDRASAVVALVGVASAAVGEAEVEAVAAGEAAVEDSASPSQARP